MQRTFVLPGLITAIAILLVPETATAQGIRGRADWMFLSRNNDSVSVPYITGPDTFSGSGVDFGYESGYRFMLGYGSPSYEIEAQFTAVDNWSEQSFATLTEELFFDNNAANAFVNGGTPGNVFGIMTALGVAAEDPFTTTLDDETLESEFLIPGANASYRYESEYADVEINITTPRCDWFRFGLGYRHVDLDERAGFAISGLFDALDVDVEFHGFITPLCRGGSFPRSRMHDAVRLE